MALTATVQTSPSGTTPTGSITFAQGNTILGTAPLSGLAPDTASLTTTALAAGANQVTASYGGDNLDAPSAASAPITINVAPVAPVLAVSANPAAAGGTLTFTATVTGPSGAATPTGSVTWVVTPPGGPAVTCPSAAGPTGAANVATYTCAITFSVAAAAH